MVSSMFRTLKTDLVFLFFIITLLCSSFLTACESGGGSGGCTQNPQPTSTQIKPFLALNVPIDNTLSFPMQYQTLAAQNIADRIDNYISPGISGMFVDVTLIETNSLQDTFVTFSVDAIQPIRPMPQVCNDPYLYAKQMRDWKKAVAKINNLVASTRARIKPFLDKLRSIHLQEVGGTDIPGAADTAAAEFSHFPKSTKVLLFVSDLQNNIDMQFSKHINLYGAKVRTIFRPCQVQSVCEQNDAFWTRQFKAWNASTVEFFSPAESEAEHITFE